MLIILMAVVQVLLLCRGDGIMEPDHWFDCVLDGYGGVSGPGGVRFYAVWLAVQGSVLGLILH